jgi:diguanylate cyclase (GGDEF)-like protein/PAS domain S-box-containing protein
VLPDEAVSGPALDGCAAADLPERALTLLEMQRELLAEATAGAHASRVLGLLVDFIEAHTAGAFASVLLLDPRTHTLNTLVAPRLPQSYSDAVDGLAIGPSVGSCGTAAFRNELVVVEEIATDPLWEDFRELAEAHGLRACWSTPIRGESGAVVGTFALYYRTARRPSQREIDLVEVAAGIASIVIERQRALERASEQAAERGEIERRYRTLVEQLPLVIYVDALDAASSNIFTSPQIEELLGYSVQEWLSDEMLFVKALHPNDRDRVLAAHAHTHRTHEPLSTEYRLRSREGDCVWIRDEGVIVKDEDGVPLYLQGYLLDISPEREAEEQLRRQAMHDALTGLANRAFFNERLAHAVSIRKEAGEHTALLFIDLNNFKSLNDRFGHPAGDVVLGVLGERLRTLIRAGDTAARLGGDEFALLLEVVSEPAEVARVAERVLEAIGEPIGVDGHCFTLEASIGIALGDDVHDLHKQADAAMYRAKSQLGLGYAFFDPELDHAALVRFRRIAELAEAVERREFRLHYQPIVALPSGEVSGYEALLRWEHPELGQVQPLQFVPLAEESGLIVPIGRWVLQEACMHAARLGAAEGRELEISVNVSARQLQHPDFVDHVDAALERAGLPAHCLVLEITESVLIETGDAVETRLATLKRKGIEIALDDFGTGYGSLAYLQRLPVDIVKIDRSFTASVDTDAAGEALLRAIVGLGNALGTRLVAEGIERQSQSEVIQDLGCHSAQGFHYGCPEAAGLVPPKSREAGRSYPGE